MKYFDTDVLVHFLINQDAAKHLESITLVQESMQENDFTLSWLSVQELGFVLAKLGKLPDFIEQKLNDFKTFYPFINNAESYQRGMELAQTLGYRNFNDCLHLAIAEQYCTDFYTYNKSDFEQAKLLTKINIHIL